MASLDSHIEVTITLSGSTEEDRNRLMLELTHSIEYSKTLTICDTDRKKTPSSVTRKYTVFTTLGDG